MASSEVRTCVGDGWRIGELARAHGLDPRTIRYYERIGVLPAPRRMPNGYRVYGPADAERLRFIRGARAMGLTLREIRDIFFLRQQGTRPCAHVLTLIDQKLQTVEHQLNLLRKLHRDLLNLRKAAQAQRGRDGHVCGIIEGYRLVTSPVSSLNSSE
jgi:DNA-binding transcriptional MerR regulator